MNVITLMVKQWPKNLITLLLFVAISTSTLANENTPLRIAVAANFAPILKKLLPDFTAKTNIKTQVISAASGTLFLQIKHGAPFDIFLSADKQRPQRLSDNQLIIENTLETYTYGKIAFWSTTNKLPTLTSFLLKIPEEQRFAIANPETAPYGKAAKEALISLGIWQELQNKLILGNNINQTFQQVSSKAVSAGIVANSQLIINGLTGLVIPAQYYQGIEQKMVILKRSKQVENAQQLSRFLLSEPVQKRLVKYGYTAVKPIISKDNLSQR